jgi:hypothetical protein
VSWTIAKGQDNGDTVIVVIDEEFRDPTRRRGRDTRVSVRFLGPHMLTAVEYRSAFEDKFCPVLERHGGVLVAGITRTRPVSYTFVGYCSAEIEPSTIPVDESLRDSCTVSVHSDPGWKEYETWLPSQARGFARVALMFRSTLFRLLSRH